MLRCQDEHGNVKIIVLRGLWIECNYQEGAEVLVYPLSTLSMDEQEILIDGCSSTMLVYLPRMVIPITTVADAVTCLRKAVLSSKVQAAAVVNKPTIHLVSGSVTHDVFETTILYPERLEGLSRTIEEAIRNHLATIYACGETESSVLSSVQSILSNFPTWCHTFIRNAPLPSALVTDELKASIKSGANGYAAPNICIPHVFSLEESISCPTLGLKGKLDAIVLVRFLCESQPVSILVPLELKTSRSSSSAAHRAQTLLYTLLLSHRYSVPVPFGLLFYVASTTLLRISATTTEMQALMMIRNRLVAASQEFSHSSLLQLPRTISNPMNCKQCSQLENCSVLTRLRGPDKLEAELYPLNDTLEAYQQSFSSEKLDDSFYVKWEQLVRLEEEEVLVSKKKLETDSQRISLKLTACKLMHDSNSFGRFLASFECLASDDNTDFVSLCETELADGDPVVILGPNDDNEAAKGFVQEIQSNATILVNCDRDVCHTLVPADEFCVERNHLLQRRSCIGSPFVLMKDEMLTGFSLARSNLVQLYAPRNNNLRELLVAHRAPLFSATQLKKDEVPSGLDAGQVEAVQHCLRAEEYALILGMPGAGKTTTLVELIRILAERSCNILVASYTHSAVDNLLVRLQDAGVSVLRLGNASRVDRRLLPRLISSSEHFPSVAALYQAIQGTRVFGTTCLSANHQLLATVSFDYCIVDEASQISVPVVLGPILQARKFILVGDHFQLPPLVRSSRAVELGLAQSLFAILAERHPQSVCTLRKQYRMCEDVQLLANRTVYRGLLQCGSESVQNARLEIDLRSIPTCLVCAEGQGSICWIDSVLNPSQRVCFLDTDRLPDAFETLIGNSFENRIEAVLIATLVHFLTEDLRVLAEQVCIISAFRPQVRALRRMIPNAAVEISTVDRFQGRDKDCVFLSFVRSNPDHQVPVFCVDHCFQLVDWKSAKRLASTQCCLY